MERGRYWSMTYNPYYEPPRRRFGTSAVELFHITVATLVLTLVLFLVFEKNPSFREILKLNLATRILAAFLISFLGFVLHELGHKFTAQHFGHWSEFRANWGLLFFSLVIAYVLNIPFAAPGATWHNAHTRTDQGKISAMGPLVNYAIAVAAIPLASRSQGASQTPLGQLAAIVVFFMTVLALFNLIPLGPLDGRKVLAWNPFVWIAMVALGVGLLIYSSTAYGLA